MKELTKKRLKYIFGFRKGTDEKLKKAESRFFKYMTRPLSPTEKKLMKFTENKDPLVNVLGDIGDITEPMKPVKKHIHEFVISDFSTNRLRCKHCGYTITANNLGKKVGKKPKKIPEDLDLDNLLKW